MGFLVTKQATFQTSFLQHSAHIGNGKYEEDKVMECVLWGAHVKKKAFPTESILLI